MSADKQSGVSSVFTKVLVGTLMVLTVLFIVAVLYINFRGKDVSDALIYGSFAFFTCEALAMAGIRVAKGKNEFTQVMDTNFGAGGETTANDDGTDSETTTDDSTTTDTDDATGDES